MLKSRGAGTNVIRIKGVKELHSTEYEVMPDRIEAGTLLCSAAITGGKINLKKIIPEHIAPVLHKLEECGSKVVVKKDVVLLEAPKRLESIDVKTMPYPGFPTDMQSIFASCLTVAKGTSVIIENIFENRYKYANELIRMGAKITIEGKMAVIKGVKKLSGALVNSTDLRGGMSLIIAGLTAEGTTTVQDKDLISRGYENIDQKLNSLGANITTTN